MLAKYTTGERKLTQRPSIRQRNELRMISTTSQLNKTLKDSNSMNNSINGIALNDTTAVSVVNKGNTTGAVKNRCSTSLGKAEDDEGDAELDLAVDLDKIRDKDFMKRGIESSSLGLEIISIATCNGKPLPSFQRWART